MESEGAVDRNEGIVGLPRWLALAALAAGSSGCVPNLNIGGVYFPPSLVSATIGVGVGYAAVQFLARNARLRPLAQSALFFLSLATIAGALAWWSLYRVF